MKINIPLLPYQKRLMHSKKPTLAFVAGTGTGKTWFIPRYLFTKMSEKKEEIQRMGAKVAEITHGIYIVSAPTTLMIYRNPLKYIKAFFDFYKIQYTFNKHEMLMTVFNGKTILGEIYFITAEKPERMQGVHADGIVGDEAGLYSKLWWDTAVQRRTYCGGWIMLTTTPYAENWLKTDIVDKAGTDNTIELVRPRTQDNPYYPKENIELARQALPNWKFRMMYEAQFTVPEGLIYKNINIIKPFPIDKSWYKFGGIDFGWNHPTAITRFAVNPRGDIFQYTEWKRSEVTTDTMYNELSKEPISYWADYAQKENMENLKLRGVRLELADKSVMNGITRVVSLFKRKKLHIFSNLPLTIDEYSTYKWAVDKNEKATDKPVKTNDDLMDASRYPLYTIKNLDTIINARERMPDWMRQEYTNNVRMDVNIYQ